MNGTAANPSKWLVFFLVAVGIFMATLDGSIVNIAIPAIMADFKVSLATIQWVVMVYLLTVTALLLSFGRLSDILGRRLVYSWGLSLFALGSLFCGLAFDASWLIGTRFFQGLGAAMIMACTPAMVVDTFPVAERGRALGLVGSVVAAGLTVGPVLGGLLTYYLSWRAIFYINVPIGLACAAIVSTMLKNSSADITRPERFDLIGALLLAVCLAPLLLAITHGYTWGYSSTPVISLLGLAGMAATLLYTASKTPHPILSPALFRVRLFALPILAAVILFASLFALVFLMPFYLIHPGKFSANKAGLIMAMIFVSLFVVAQVSGALSDRIGSRLLCTLGMAILSLALFALALLPADAGIIDIAWRLTLAGVGTAIFIPPNSAVAMSAVPAAHRGVASGTVAAARNLGMVLGVALSGAIFNGVYFTLSDGRNLQDYHPGLEAIFMEAFKPAMMSAGVLACLGMVVAFLRGLERQARQQ